MYSKFTIEYVRSNGNGEKTFPLINNLVIDKRHSISGINMSCKYSNNASEVSHCEQEMTFLSSQRFAFQLLCIRINFKMNVQEVI